VATKHQYPNVRSQLWFDVADCARAGGIYLSRLDRKTLRQLKAQLMAPEWDLTPTGQRAVEPKKKTREKIGRSPDDADGFNLAHFEGLKFQAAKPIDEEPRTVAGVLDAGPSHAMQRLFGLIHHPVAGVRLLVGWCRVSRGSLSPASATSHAPARA
jgi:hypothetical protein